MQRAGVTGTPHAVARHCLQVGSFHVNVTAGAYSQLCGVLAGFGFFAIIYVLTTNAQRALTRGQRRDIDRVLVALFCATYGFAIATLQYAILSGESGAGLTYGRAASEELMADISLTSSILTLSYGLILLIAADHFIRTNRLVRVIASVGGPPLAVFFICGTAIDIAVGRWATTAGTLLCRHNGFYAETQALVIVLPAAVLAVSLFCWVLPYLLPATLRPRLWRLVRRIRDAPSVASLAVVFCAAAVGGAFNVYEAHSRLSATGVWIALAACCTLISFQAVAIRFAANRGMQRHPPKTSARRPNARSSRTTSTSKPTVARRAGRA